VNKDDLLVEGQEIVTHLEVAVIAVMTVEVIQTLVMKWIIATVREYVCIQCVEYFCLTPTCARVVRTTNSIILFNMYLCTCDVSFKNILTLILVLWRWICVAMKKKNVKISIIQRFIQ
jgi:hypothetical protein